MPAPRVPAGSCPRSTSRRSVTTPIKKAPIGAGPYKFVSFTPGVELVLEAFDQYWRKAPSVKRIVLRVIPDESTRLAALKRGEVDIAYSIRARTCRGVAAHTRPHAEADGRFGAVLDVFPRAMGSEVAVARSAGAAGRQPGDRPQDDQPGTDARPFAPDGQRLPGELRILLATTAAGLRSGQGQAAAGRRRASRMASTPASIPATPSYANLGEAVLNNLGEVGIRAKLRPLERVAFFKGYADKKFKNIIQGASGAFGNTATTAGGVCRHRRQLHLWQLSRHRRPVSKTGERAATVTSVQRFLQKMQQLALEKNDLRADLAARVHQWRGAAGW